MKSLKERLYRPACLGGSFYYNDWLSVGIGKILVAIMRSRENENYSEKYPLRLSLNRGFS